MRGQSARESMLKEWMGCIIMETSEGQNTSTESQRLGTEPERMHGQIKTTRSVLREVLVKY